MSVASRFTGRLNVDASVVLHSMKILKMPRLITDINFAGEKEEKSIFSLGLRTCSLFLFESPIEFPPWSVAQSAINLGDHRADILIKYDSHVSSRWISGLTMADRSRMIDNI